MSPQPSSVKNRLGAKEFALAVSLLICGIFLLVNPTYYGKSLPESHRDLDIIAYRPLSYDVTIKTYLPGFDAIIAKEKHYHFEGKVTIEIESLKTLAEIRIPYLHLKIKEVITSVKLRTWDTKDDAYIVIMLDSLEAGTKFSVTIKYCGTIETNLNGLYRTGYNVNSTAKIGAVTQFEPTHAMEAVPCIDEPRFKVPWKVTIIHPAGTQALSNALEYCSEREGDFIRTEFETTPKMPSYLLAFFISDYTSISITTKNGVDVFVWTPPHLISKATLALNAAATILTYFEDLFGIRYPLSKLDFVAVSQFSAAAMENLGLIIHRTDYLLEDRGNSFPIVETVAHELAHQWFGNLVTLQTWDHIWLNEGLATYFQSIGAASFFKGYDVKVNLANWRHILLQKDRNSTSLPLVHHFLNKTEIFSVNSYYKGCLIVNMIRGIVGEEKFMQSIKRYLRKVAYQNAVSDDFLREFGSDVEDRIRPWLYEPNYPIVTVSQFNQTHVRLQQRSVIDKDNHRKWDIPIWIRRINKTSVQLMWLYKDEDLYVKGKISDFEIDPDQYGYYDVEVDDEKKSASSVKKAHSQGMDEPFIKY